MIPTRFSSIFFLLFDEICERLKWKECFVFDYFQIKYQE